jgi:hypothetical protein
MDFKLLVGTIVRHGVGALAAAFVAKGYLSPDEAAGWVEAITGAIVLTGVGVWSYVSRKKLAGK